MRSIVSDSYLSSTEFMNANSIPVVIYYKGEYPEQNVKRALTFELCLA
jgi:hypothetical protein